MRSLLFLLPLLLGFSVPAIAHNEFNGGLIGGGPCAGCNGGGIYKPPTGGLDLNETQEDAEAVSESDSD